MKALTWQGKRGRPRRGGARPRLEEPNDADHPGDLHRRLRLGPAPVRRSWAAFLKPR